LFDKQADNVYCRVMCKVMLITLRGTVGCLSQQLLSSCCAVRAVRIFNKQLSYFVNYYFTTNMQVLRLRKLSSELCCLSVSLNKSSDSLCKLIGKSVTYCNITAYTVQAGRAVFIFLEQMLKHNAVYFLREFLKSWLKEYTVYCR
jgi:hypothetical protein